MDRLIDDVSGTPQEQAVALARLKVCKRPLLQRAARSAQLSTMWLLH